MTTFRVSLEETLLHTAIVEAEDKVEAMSKAYDIIMNGPEIGFTTESLGTSDEYQVTEVPN